jgi:hypothetical protein
MLSGRAHVWDHKNVYRIETLWHKNSSIYSKIRDKR